MSECSWDDEMLDKVDSLEKECDELKAALATAREELERQEERVEISAIEAVKFAMMSARSVAMEEAARAIDGIPLWDSDGRHPADRIRALAPLPESLCVVERETMEKVREALGFAQLGWALCEGVHDIACTRCRIDAALALLEKVKP